MARGSVSTALRRPEPLATDMTAPVDLTGLNPDQQFQAALFCGNQRATLSTPLTTCAPSRFG